MPEIYELLREHEAALVIADRPEIRPFQTHELTADFVFLRIPQQRRRRQLHAPPAVAVGTPDRGVAQRA